MSKAKQKRLIILLAVLCVVSIATLCIKGIETHQEKIKNSDATIVSIDPDKTESINWTYSGGLSFVKNDDVWNWEDDENFPVDTEKLNEVLEVFEDFKASFEIDDVTDFAQYGLVNPTAVIYITADGTDYEIKIGSYSTMDEERYVSIGDGNVYLAAVDPLNSINKSISDFILDDEIPSLTTAASITFAGTESYSVTYDDTEGKSIDADDTYFKGSDALDSSKVKTYLKNLGNITITSYESYNADADTLKSCGLDTPEQSITLSYTDKDGEHEFTLNIGRDADALAEAEAIEDESKRETKISAVQAYAQVEGSKIVYKLSSSDYTKLTECSYNDLRHDEIFTGDMSQVNKMEFTIDGETYTFYTEDEKKDKEYVWHLKEDDEIDVSDIEDAVAALEATSFTSDKATEKKEISFTLYLDNENYPSVSVILYRYDGSSCLAYLNGKPVALIDRADAVDLIEAVNSLVLDSQYN